MLLGHLWSTPSLTPGSENFRAGGARVLGQDMRAGSASSSERVRNLPRARREKSSSEHHCARALTLWPGRTDSSQVSRSWTIDPIARRPELAGSDREAERTRLGMRRVIRDFLAGATAASIAVALWPGTRAHKLMRRELRNGSRKLRYLEGRMRGVRYRLSGARPDPSVIDNVLADRIRSELGGLEHQLDLPHIHVMVEKHVALLHGEVGSDADAERIEEAVAAVPGVEGVESYLHSGLTRGDTRPSAGRAIQPPSSALAQLRATAEGAGVLPSRTDVVLRGVLATFAERLPDAQRDHLGSHLPEDVRALLAPPRRIRQAAKPRNVSELVTAILSSTGDDLPPEKAEQATAVLLRALRELVPGDAASVGAVLPRELRSFWSGLSAAS